MNGKLNVDISDCMGKILKICILLNDVLFILAGQPCINLILIRTSHVRLQITCNAIILLLSILFVRSEFILDI